MTVNWTCPACTLENPGSASRCEVCAHERPKEGNKVSWTCQACTFENPASSMKCDVCLFDPNVEPVKKPAKVASPRPVPAVLPQAECAAEVNPQGNPEATPAPVLPPLPKVEEVPVQESKALAEQPSLGDELKGQEVSREVKAPYGQEAKQEQKPCVEDRPDGQVIAQPKELGPVECVACMESFAPKDMFMLACSESHRLCLACVKRLVEDSLGAGLIPSCPYNCGYMMSSMEVRMLYGDGSLLNKINELALKHHIAMDPRYIPCPQPNCPEYCYVSNPVRRQRCQCMNPGCGLSYCSSCKGEYHFKLTCPEVAPTAEVWFDWIRKDRRLFMQQKQQESLALDAALSAAETAFRNLQRDETWKEWNCKLCPNCSRVIYRISGCDNMVCGNDVHGGNAQDGCGKPFNWAFAKPYKRGSERDNLPRILKDVDLLKAATVCHYLIAGDVSSKNKIKCDVCKLRLVGPRFSCVHCPVGLELCLACVDQLLLHVERKKNGGYVTEYAQGHPCFNHKSSHLFQVFLEESVL